MQRQRQKRKRAKAKREKNALFRIGCFLTEGETVLYGESLPGGSFLSVYSAVFILPVLLLALLCALLWERMPAAVRLTAAALGLFAAFHGAIRCFCPAYAAVTQNGVYLLLATPRKRLYRILFTELARVRVRKGKLRKGKTRFAFFRTRFTVGNSPMWKQLRLRMRDPNRIKAPEYTSLECYTPVFLQLLSENGERLAELIPPNR